MTEYLLQGKLNAIDGNSSKLAEILINASKLVSTAKGCRLYLVSQSNEDINAVYVTEIWDTKEDHDNSLKIDGVMDLIGQAMPLLDGKPEGKELKIIGGLGV